MKTAAHLSIGVLSVQGSFAEHCASLRQLGASVRQVRLPQHLEGLDGIVIPGGESTTLLKLMDTFELREPLRDAITQGLPALGTCAGVIVLARQVSSHDMHTLEVLDITVARNAFGRQTDSFEEDLLVEPLAGPAFRGVFIRAPIIEVCGDSVRVLSRLQDGTVVACQQAHILATSFHPEFVPDSRIHQHFLNIAAACRRHVSNTRV